MTLVGSNQDEFKVVAISDGTVTQVELVARRYSPYQGEVWEQIGLGVAKRRKGDTRNENLGMSLALQRAFESAAAYYREAAETFGEKE